MKKVTNDCNKDEVRNAMRRMDLNGDGRCCLAEFVEALGV